jgi:N6-L-threonylcarbamoyladenine synthase
MNLLALETSCDETAAAVIEETAEPSRPWAIRSNIVASQTDIHRAWGGVVPELASRQHVRDICGVVEAALEEARITLDDLGAVAVTQGPGLVGSLLVGVAFAKSLGWTRGLPVVPVHHLAGHIESLTLAHGELPLPAAVLVVSGGHTSLYHVASPGVYQLVGRTRDDAAGEAYDKVAKLLGLGYPGGPEVSKLAEQGRPGRHALPRPMIASGDLDFSFSGLKTAVLLAARKEPGLVKADLARAFVDAVVEVLVAKCVRALDATGLARLVVAGGVGANKQLRESLGKEAERRGFELFYPEAELCTDNGAMIALAAALRLERGNDATPAGFTVKPRWDLAAAR